MQSAWRIACVRIPRFPIAAAQRELVVEGAMLEAGTDETAKNVENEAERNGSDRAALNSRTPNDRTSNGRTSNGRTSNGRIPNGRIPNGRIPNDRTPNCPTPSSSSRSSLPWDDRTVERAAMEVTAALIAASPRVTPVACEPGIWWVGANGFDQMGGEVRLARDLLETARRWSPRARVAVADSCVAARAATWSSVRGPRGRDTVIVPVGGDARYLSSAPLALIPMDAELRDAFASLGMRTAGALAALDAEDVERRWGNEGLAAWRLARGDDRRRPTLARMENPRSVEATLPSPATTIEPLLFLVHAALDRLSGDLARDGRSAATVAVTLVLDDVRSALPGGAAAHTVTREVRLPRPTARASHLFEHCRALLERWPLDAAASAVRVAIAATAPSSGEQGDLLSASWRDAAAMDAALARLRAELGSGSVVRPVERDEHRPDQAGEWGEEAEGRKQKAGSRKQELRTNSSRPRKKQSHPRESGDPSNRHPRESRDPFSMDLPRRVLRLVEDPEPVDVEVDMKRGAEAPCAVWWNGRRVTITRCSEPERLSGKWWDDDGSYRRDYWICDSESGELLLFVDHAGGGGWYLQGWYD